MDSIEIDGDWKEETLVTLIRTGDDGSGEYVTRHIEHGAFVRQVLQWFRSAPKDIVTNALVALFVEHHVTAHIHTKTEEEHLQELNMRQEHMLENIQLAIARAYGKRREYHVYLPDVLAAVRDLHCDLPESFVLGVLKGWELNRTCVDIGDNYFSFEQRVIDGF